MRLEFILSKTKFRLLIILLLTPIFWWVLINFNQVVSGWLKSPIYIESKISRIYSTDNLRHTIELRWVNVETVRQGFLPRLFYNKATVIIDQFFDYLSIFSPKLYFQQGDNGISSPPGVEPIPVILYPFFIAGIYFLIKEKDIKSFQLLFILGILAFITDQKNFYFLFPVAIFYLSIASRGVELLLSPKNRLYFIISLFLYSTFLITRILFLTL